MRRLGTTGTMLGSRRLSGFELARFWGGKLDIHILDLSFFDEVVDAVQQNLSVYPRFACYPQNPQDQKSTV